MIQPAQASQGKEITQIGDCAPGIGLLVDHYHKCKHVPLLLPCICYLLLELRVRVTRPKLDTRHVTFTTYTGPRFPREVVQQPLAMVPPSVLVLLM